MDLKKLKEKIKDTTLFTEREKVLLLVDLDTLSEDALTNLEESIDDYAFSIASVGIQYKHEYLAELQKILAETPPTEQEEVKEAIEKIQRGMNTIIPG